MREAVLGILIIGGFFVLRAVLATVFFFYLLPEGVNCPNCDAVTLRIEGRKLRFLMPRFRKSWCIDCGWHGLLRESTRLEQNAGPFRYTEKRPSERRGPSAALPPRDDE